MFVMDTKMRLKSKLKSLPDKPGVYKMLNSDNAIIYIGAARVLKNRVTSYFREKQLDIKTRKLVENIVDFDYEIHDTEEKAFLRERELIRAHRPKYNINWLDGKEYPMLQITMPPREKFSRILITRERTNKTDHFFSRKFDVGALRNSIRTLRHVFPIANKSYCFKTKKPCLDYRIDRCSGPCVEKISLENYQQIVEDLILFLKGKSTDLLQRLYDEMTYLSSQLNYEKAAKIRDKINQIETLIEREIVLIKERKKDIIIIIEDYDKKEKVSGCAILIINLLSENMMISSDVIYLIDIEVINNESLLSSFIQDYYLESSFIPEIIEIPELINNSDLLENWLSKKKGTSVRIKEYSEKFDEKINLTISKTKIELSRRITKLSSEIHLRNTSLKEIKAILGLKNLPTRIEGYDISNLQGKLPVASMVVFIDGKRASSHYRKFKMKKSGPDDVGMMKEVLTRRLLDEQIADRLPDLILVDGGLPQVNGAYSIIKKLKKNIPVIGLAKKEELIFLPNISEPVIKFKETEALRLFQRLRDEAHRFAITYHKSRRLKEIKTGLDHIPNIGSKRRNELMKYFGSMSRIKNASVEELSEVPGFSRKLAEAIYTHFRTKPE